MVKKMSFSFIGSQDSMSEVEDSIELTFGCMPQFDIKYTCYDL